MWDEVSRGCGSCKAVLFLKKMIWGEVFQKPGMKKTLIMCFWIVV